MPKLADTITGARLLGNKVAQSQRRANPDGRMPLMDHLRELRNRLIKAVAAIVIALGIGLIPFVHDHLWTFVYHPFKAAAFADIGPYLDGSMISTDNVLTEGAMQGQTFFASSGDNGDGCAFVAATGVPSSFPGTNWPASGMYTTGVGGTSLISDQSASHHHKVARMRGEFYCGFAEHDPYAPPAMIAQLEELLTPCQVRYSYQIHKGAEHGYALPDRDIYDKRAADRDWERIFAMFHRQIPPYSR